MIFTQPQCVGHLVTNELGTPAKMDVIQAKRLQNPHALAFCFMVKSPSTFSPVLKLKHLAGLSKELISCLSAVEQHIQHIPVGLS